MKYTTTLVAVGLTLAAVLPASSALAQNARSFVSPQGNDANTCTLNSPCRNFQPAYNRTNPGGEIAVLGTAGYGTLVIDHAISIVNGGGFEAGVFFGAGGTGITINAPAADAVSLRGLTIDGQGTGYNGILFNSGASLTVQDCVIRHMANGGDTAALAFMPTTPSRLSVSRTTVSDNQGIAIYVKPSGGNTSAVINNVEANNNSDGVYVFGSFNGGAPVKVMVTNTVVSGNYNTGIYSESYDTMPVILDHVVMAHNNYGLISRYLGSQVAFYHSIITGNTHGWASLNSGTVLTYSNSAMDYNDGDQAAPGALPQK